MDAEALKDRVITVLDDMKGRDIRCLEVGELTSVADYMVVVTGTSTRHVKSMADELGKRIKEAGVMPRGVEGENQAEWILMDLGDVVVHLMQQSTRDLYDLESLWGLGHARPT